MRYLVYVYLSKKAKTPIYADVHTDETLDALIGTPVYFDSEKTKMIGKVARFEIINSFN